jgi:hypothetical protein
MVWLKRAGHLQAILEGLEGLQGEGPMHLAAAAEDAR